MEEYLDLFKIVILIYYLINKTYYLIFNIFIKISSSRLIILKYN
jgi:hypothetical protein